MQENRDSAPDFDLEFYKAHRAHETVLNNATAGYEQSLLRLILVLNAASSGGFATLLITRTEGNADQLAIIIRQSARSTCGALAFYSRFLPNLFGLLVSTAVYAGISFPATGNR